MLQKRNKKLCGVGINDADYNVSTWVVVDNKKVIKTCPFYSVWRDMLRRCYDEKFTSRYPRYLGCYVVDEWLYFSNFKAWVEQQDYKNKELDKDLLIRGNKEYGPTKCVFLQHKVNSFLLESNAARGEYPIGVCFDKIRGLFVARCKQVNTGKRIELGLFKTPEEAHKVWLAFKLEQAKILASEIRDERISNALIHRYLDYKED